MYMDDIKLFVKNEMAHAQTKILEVINKMIFKRKDRIDLQNIAVLTGSKIYACFENKLSDTRKKSALTSTATTKIEGTFFAQLLAG